MVTAHVCHPSSIPLYTPLLASSMGVKPSPSHLDTAGYESGTPRKCVCHPSSQCTFDHSCWASAHECLTCVSPAVCVSLLAKCASRQSWHCGASMSRSRTAPPPRRPQLAGCRHQYWFSRPLHLLVSLPWNCVAYHTHVWPWGALITLAGVLLACCHPAGHGWLVRQSELLLGPDTLLQRAGCRTPPAAWKTRVCLAASSAPLPQDVVPFASLTHHASTALRLRGCPAMLVHVVAGAWWCAAWVHQWLRTWLSLYAYSGPANCCAAALVHSASVS
jgi:hypothetical protein